APGPGWPRAGHGRPARGPPSGMEPAMRTGILGSVGALLAAAPLSLADPPAVRPADPPPALSAGLAADPPPLPRQLPPAPGAPAPAGRAGGAGGAAPDAAAAQGLCRGRLWAPAGQAGRARRPPRPGGADRARRGLPGVLEQERSNPGPAGPPRPAGRRRRRG